MRTTLTGVATLTLVAAIAGMAVAQTEIGESEAPVGVDIDATWLHRLEGGELTMAGEPGAAWSKLYGLTLAEEWEATDPRVSGDVISRTMRHAYPLHGYEIEAIEYALANDGGSWAGTSIGIWPGGLGAGGAESMVLHGAGAYEGLTAYLTRSCPQDCPDSAHATLHGLIVAEALPPLPDVPAE